MRNLMYKFFKDLNLDSLDLYLDGMEELNERYSITLSGELLDSKGNLMATCKSNHDYEKEYIYSEEFKTKALEIITQLVKLRIEGWLD